MLLDARRRIGRIAREQLLDRGERQLQLAHHHDQACLVELGYVVVAIARRLIDARRHQHPAFVIEAERLQRKAGPSCELPDADLFHADSLVAGPIRPGRMSVRSPPRAESRLLAASHLPVADGSCNGGNAACPATFRDAQLTPSGGEAGLRAGRDLPPPRAGQLTKATHAPQLREA